MATKNEKLIFGIGINDAGYAVRKFKTIGYVNGKQIQEVFWYCPYYSIWKSMMGRVYSTTHPAYKYYKNCSVYSDWLRFSNFKSWMETQDWENKCLDKDILAKDGIKIYSPETCVFVSQEVNKFILEQNNRANGLPTGVVCTGKYHDRFVARYKWKGVSRNIGTFDTPEEAHEAWKAVKLSLLPELNIKDIRVLEALENRYKPMESYNG